MIPSNLRKLLLLGEPSEQRAGTPPAPGVQGAPYFGYRFRSTIKTQVFKISLVLTKNGKASYAKISDARSTSVSSSLHDGRGRSIRRPHPMSLDRATWHRGFCFTACRILPDASILSLSGTWSLLPWCIVNTPRPSCSLNASEQATLL